jgi:putative transposase
VSRQFAEACGQTLDICRELYNASLQERRDAWRLQRVTISYHDQRAQLPDIKLVRDDVEAVYSQVLQDVLRRLSKTFDAFFRRLKKGEQPGFPRFKSKSSFDSFTYPQSGFRLDGDKLTLSKIGSCRLRLSRPVEGTIKTCTIKREIDGWYVVFAVLENRSRWFPKTGDIAGVDVGISAFATISTGEEISNPRFLRTAERGLKIAQRRVSRKWLRSANRRKAIRLLAKRYRKVARQRLDFFHKTSLKLIREFDHVVFEDLNIAGMVKNRRLAKSIMDAAWGTFLNVHFAKAENAGRIAEKINPYCTSQDCCECGARMKLSLSQRVFHCTACGSTKGRDHNAAINIKLRAGLVHLRGLH